MPPLIKRVADADFGDGPLAKKQVPVEKHDSGFITPMILFKPFPHNTTFIENRIVKINAIPGDDPLSSTFTFSYNGSAFGLIKTNDATLEADLRIVDTANANAGYAANYNVGIIPFPMRTMWKSKEILINDVMVNNLTNQDHIIAWIRHITTEVKSDFWDSRKITLGEHDTAGHFDEIYAIGNADNATYQNGNQQYHPTTAANSPHGADIDAGGNGHTPMTNPNWVNNTEAWQRWPKCNNMGLRNRSRLLSGQQRRVIDTLDTVCFNENGTDKYFPSDFNIKVILHKNQRNKYIRGGTGATAAGGVDSADVAITNFVLCLPMYKPQDQLAAAINRTMVTNEEECIFYTTHYRLVTRSIQANSNQIRENDIFTGSRPSRVYMGLYTQTRWNGGFGHRIPAANHAIGTCDNDANARTAFQMLPANTEPVFNHPLRAQLPNFNYCALRINQGIVNPEYRNQQEAYNEFRRMLNRQNREMPFDFDAYQTDYGWLAFDLHENKDTFNEVLPNSTSGNIDFEMTLEANLPNVAHQGVFIAEFRNEVKVGVNTPPRKMVDY